MSSVYETGRNFIIQYLKDNLDADIFTSIDEDATLANTIVAGPQLQSTARISLEVECVANTQLVPFETMGGRVGITYTWQVMLVIANTTTDGALMNLKLAEIARDVGLCMAQMQRDESGATLGLTENVEAVEITGFTQGDSFSTGMQVILTQHI